MSASGGASRPIFLRCYGRALRLLPRTFREAHGDAMLAMLEDEWRERGRAGRVVLACRSGLDLVATVVATRIGASDNSGAWVSGLREDVTPRIDDEALAVGLPIARMLAPLSGGDHVRL